MVNDAFAPMLSQSMPTIYSRFQCGGEGTLVRRAAYLSEPHNLCVCARARMDFFAMVVEGFHVLSSSQEA